eukprot:g19551.t1
MYTTCGVAIWVLRGVSELLFAVNVNFDCNCELAKQAGPIQGCMAGKDDRTKRVLLADDQKGQVVCRVYLPSRPSRKRGHLMASGAGERSKTLLFYYAQHNNERKRQN